MFFCRRGSTHSDPYKEILPPAYNSGLKSFPCSDTPYFKILNFFLINIIIPFEFNMYEFAMYECEMYANNKKYRKYKSFFRLLANGNIYDLRRFLSTRRGYFHNFIYTNLIIYNLLVLLQLQY